MKNIVIGNLTFLYDENMITIKNSYTINKSEDMKWYLIHFKGVTGYKTKRSVKSWLKEWKCHNISYKLGILKSHSIDCDLEENINIWFKLLYNIVSIFYRG